MLSPSPAELSCHTPRVQNADATLLKLERGTVVRSQVRRKVLHADEGGILDGNRAFRRASKCDITYH